MFNIGVNSAIVTRFTSEVVRGGSTGSHVTGSMFCACGSRAFFLTIGAVQNVPLRMTGNSMATGCDVIKCHVIGSEHVRMRNRKLRNIHLSGAFSPEATSSNVT